MKKEEGTMNKIQNLKTLAAVEREREREREGLFYSTWNSFTRLVRPCRLYNLAGGNPA